MTLTPVRLLWSSRYPGLKEGIDRVFDDFFGRSVPAFEAPWIPAVDVHETKKNVIVSFEAPSIDPKEVEISVSGDKLSVRGEKKREEELQNEDCFISERIYGSFQRVIQLPVEVAAEKAKASYKDGVLKITIPKSEKVLPKEIKVEVG